MHRIINVIAGVIVIVYCIFSFFANIQNDTNWILIAVVGLIISVQIQINYRNK